MSEITNEELREEITHLRNRVDSAEEAAKAAKKPWYRNISTVISIAAFAFSFGTTIVSYYRTKEQDVHSLRAELRGIEQRLMALPKESVEAFTKYRSDPDALRVLSGFLNQENLILSQQANDALKRLPKDQITATDYRAVAVALVNSRNFELAMVNFRNALTVANALDDEVDTLRAMSELQMTMGNIADARTTFQRALEIFTKYPGYDDLTRKSTTIITEMSWAASERNAGNPEFAEAHLKRAEQTAMALPPGVQSDVIRSQVNQLRLQMLGPPPPINPSLPGVPTPLLPNGLLPSTGPIKATQ
jgi:tetratricopeptide (TPR) repeat protein